MPPIEAVLVDVGGVLVLPDHDRMVGAFERAGVRVDRDQLDRAHYAGVAALTEFTEGDREIWAEYNRAYARACDAPDDAVEHLLNEFATGEVWSRIVHGSVDALRRLGALGVRLAIVSNADGNAEQRLRDDAVCQVGPGRGATVGAIFDSTVIGVAKPDPRIFEMALEALAAPPACAPSSWTHTTSIPISTSSASPHCSTWSSSFGRVNPPDRRRSSRYAPLLRRSSSSDAPRSPRHPLHRPARRGRFRRRGRQCVNRRSRRPL